jgi:DNA repair protein RadD
MKVIQPRDYQLKFISDISAELKAGHRGVLGQLATGGGKTVIASYMVQKIVQSGRVCWFNVHRSELIKQTGNTFNAFGIPYGVICSGFKESPNELTQINSIMSLKNRLKKHRSPDYIFWDECQFMGATTWRNIFNEFPNARHIGLSATPVRLDGKGFADFFSSMVRGPTISWLIKEKYLSDYTIFCPTNFSTEGIKKTAGDFDSRQVAELMNKPTIVGDCFEQWNKYSRNLQTIAFSPNILFSESLVEQFRSRGVSAHHVDGTTPAGDRERIISAYAKGEIQFLSNCNLFIEGFDVPNIGCILDAAPTMSVARHLQKLGRGLRTAAGKEKLIVLDQWNGYLRHGLIDDDRDWSLEGRDSTKKKNNKNETPTKRCPACFAANSSFNAYCTNCGHAFEVQKRTGPEQIDGDLQELDKAEFKKLRKKEEKNIKSLDEAIELGVLRGYKNPRFWAIKKYGNKFNKGR